MSSSHFGVNVNVISYQNILNHKMRFSVHESIYIKPQVIKNDTGTVLLDEIGYRLRIEISNINKPFDNRL